MNRTLSSLSWLQLVLAALCYCSYYAAHRLVAEAWSSLPSATVTSRRSRCDLTRRSIQVIKGGAAATTTTRSVVLSASTRRDMIQKTTVSGPAVSLLLGLVGMITTTTFAPDDVVSAAELDYNKIQDLLGTDTTAQYEPGPGKRPSYLTEPTSEFLENEKKAAAFRAANIQKQTTFTARLEQITYAPNDELLLTTALDEMRRQVKADRGLPIGITKDMIVKTCRRRKSLKYWPTNVEIAYQDLLLEIAYQQSPNTDRDTNML